ncbi:aspartate aminotransferase [Micromonospora matsumotoense]|uniref:Aminotransferase n=1 Tax=Micromonospora matsumotoense TaxID=121616 RepID=A0A1C5AXH1_9ACTN|nr:pyridoxal phosphate-dependent aminotransferase [Micromonospora matsumotoense]SCF49846.1 aspartate aminotransferase [Micromonospora matsumotoense]
MPSVGSYAQAVGRSGFRAISEWLQELPGPEVALHIGAPDLPSPAHVVAAVEQAVRRGTARYGPNRGEPELVEAIRAKLVRQNDVRVGTEQVLVTAGATQGVQLALSAILAPGQEVLVPDPGWPNYAMAVRSLGGVARPYALAADGSAATQLAELERAITPATHVIVVNSPGNPTGAVLSAETLHGLVDLARRRDLWVVSDECYESFQFTGPHLSPAALDDERVISCFSFSKTFAMPGMRVGYLVVPRSLSALCLRLQEMAICCVNIAAQAGALAALEGPQQALTDMRTTYLRRRAGVTRRLRDAGIPYTDPQGAFYVFARVTAPPFGHDDKGGDWDWTRELLREKRVLVAPGSTFGARGGGWVRIALTADDEALAEGIARLVAFCHADADAASLTVTTGTADERRDPVGARPRPGPAAQ